MANTLKTALLLGALSGCCSFRRGARRRAGPDVRASVRRRDELRLVLVLGQDRAAHVPRAGGRARAIGCTRSSSGSPQRAGLPMPTVYVIPDAVAERVRDRAQSASTRRSRRPKGSCGCSATRARRRDRARARARQAPRHPDQLGRRDDRGGDHDARAHGAVRDVLRRRPATTSASGSNPIALLAMIILAPIAAMLIQMAISRSREFAADAGGAADRRRTRTAGERAAQDRRGVEADAAGRQSGDGAHVHHQAVQRAGVSWACSAPIRRQRNGSAHSYSRAGNRPSVAVKPR